MPSACSEEANIIQLPEQLPVNRQSGPPLACELPGEPTEEPNQIRSPVRLNRASKRAQQEAPALSAVRRSQARFAEWAATSYNYPS
jgi:hypothetical protein